MKKVTKKTLAILLVFCILAIMIPTIISNAATVGDLIVSGGVEGTDYSYNAATRTLTILSDEEIIISGSTTEDKILIQKDVPAVITLSDLSIDVSGTPNSCALKIADDSEAGVDIILIGENHLKSGSNFAGLQKNGLGGSIGTLVISGTGSLTVTGGAASAGIGGGKNHSTSDIIINSGTITAYGSNSGAGIGGGYTGKGINITINGGVIQATGGINAAGIGGGYMGDGENITIENATVTAATQSNASGIGGGSQSSGLNITIKSGIVTATGGNAGSGIGGGWEGNGCDITIEGGIITATGGSSGSGIGGGGGTNSGYGSRIKIYGGTVTATGYSSSAGIGGGYKGAGSFIEIHGGTVTAKGGVAIGSGPFREGIIGGDDEDGSFNIIAPAPGYQISVMVGPNALGATPLPGSPFTVETDYINTSPYLYAQTDLTGPASGEGYSIDFVNETISIENGYEMNTASDFNGTSVANGQSITSYIGTTLYIRIAENGGVPASAAINATIPERPAAPAAPSVFSVTHNQIILNTIAGAEYRLQGGVWQNSTEFTSISPNTLYTFNARMKATLTEFASEQSTGQIYTLEMEEIGYTISGTKNGDWYVTDIEITPIAGVHENFISIKTEGVWSDWKPSHTISTETTNGSVTFRLTNATHTVITDEETFLYKLDKTAPEGTVYAAANSWSELLSNIAFTLFFKDTVHINATGSDLVSGLASIQYQKVSQKSDYNENGSWTDFSAFDVTSYGKIIVYVKITDNARNTTIICSDGLIVYSDSEINPISVCFWKANPSDMSTLITFKGASSVTSITAGGVSIGAQNYTISGSTIIIKKEYLSTKPGGDLVLTISFDLGEPAIFTIGINEPVPVYHLSVTAGEGGSVTQGINGAYGEGMLIGITAMPDPGYQFFNWTSSNGVVFDDAYCSSTTFYMPSETTVITANFQEIDPVYHLTVTAGEGGSVTQGISGEYSSGTLISLTAMPDPGYQFVNWTSSGSVTFDDANSRSTTIIMPAETIVITANFIAVENIGYTISGTKNGDWYVTDIVITPIAGASSNFISVKTGGVWSAWKSSHTISGETTGGSVTFRLSNTAGTTITEEETFQYKLDKTAPVCTLTAVGVDFWTELLNTVNFELYIKNAVEISITSGDTTSGVESIQYQIVSQQSEFNINGPWTNFTPFSINSLGSFIVYAKSTDRAGNTTIICSEGMTIYYDSSITPTVADFDKFNPLDVSIIFTLNGSTSVTGVTADGVPIGAGSYTVSGNTLVIKKEYLATQPEGSLELTIMFDLGEPAILSINITDSTPLPPVYSMTIIAGEGGSVTQGINGEYEEGALISIAAMPDPGYQF